MYIGQTEEILQGLEPKFYVLQDMSLHFLEVSLCGCFLSSTQSSIMPIPKFQQHYQIFMWKYNAMNKCEHAVYNFVAYNDVRTKC